MLLNKCLVIKLTIRQLFWERSVFGLIRVLLIMKLVPTLFAFLYSVFKSYGFSCIKLKDCYQ